MHKKLNTDEFIRRSLHIHGDIYDYSCTNYVNNKTKVEIICPIHGIFEQFPDAHYNGIGCKECGKLKCVNTKLYNNTINRKKEIYFQPDDYKLIPLSKGRFAKVDNEDFDDLICISWNLLAGKYASNSKKGLMHRIVMKATDGLMVDHKNHDTLDNRKENLRICTNQENQMNRLPKNKYKGCYKTPKGRWQSKIEFNKKSIYLGTFDTEIEAAKAYDTKAKELFGDFACLNFVSL